MTYEEVDSAYYYVMVESEENYKSQSHFLDFVGKLFINLSYAKE